MSATLRRPMTAAEFLEWEEQQETKFEFDGFAPEAMVGVTVAHSTIQQNLALAFGTRLAGRPCRFHGSDLKLWTQGRYRYPDGMVVCRPLGKAETVATDPTVVFEILSPSTATKDIGVKNQEYSGLASVRRYVILEQERAAVLVFSRGTGSWTGQPSVGVEAMLEFPELQVGAVSLRELYDGLDET